MKKYDYIIVGSGLFGAVICSELKKKGYKCLIVEARDHIGGNIYTEDISGIHVHKYGAHIFHTDKKWLWDYVNNITPFDNYINSPIAIHNNMIFNLPFNMNTFYQIWGCKTPQEAQDIISKQTQLSNINNLEDKAISLVGKDIYNILIKEYTEKQWGKKCSQLPPDIITRLPVRFTFDNNYFNDNYQGIPTLGYTELIRSLIKDTDIHMNTNFLDKRDTYESMADKIIYTGRIDSYYNYQLGKLEFRGLRFEEVRYNIDNKQGNAVINYTDHSVPYTRSIEHKHFSRSCNNKEFTIISYEYPMSSEDTNNPILESYYPINDKKNNDLYNKYKSIKNDKVIFAGRLGSYKYYDMDDTIEAALKLSRIL